jgi:hypothetical protein
MKPIISEGGGLESFERTLRGRKIPLAIEDVAYFWGIDPYVEIGHPQSSPATAAMAAAGVLMSVDEFAAAFFARGAIKATVLAVPQGTRKEDRDSLEKWYTGLMTGIKNAFTARVLNADAVTATVIGEGIEGLENTSLTKDKREEISTALGIPQSKLFSTSATDSNRVEDEKAYLNDLIVPQTRLYEGIFNSQIFDDMGLRWKFRPQEMAVLQEDEKERSEAMLNYVMAGVSQTVAAAILGVDVPEGFAIEDKEEPVEDDKQDMRESRQEAIDKKLDEKRKFHRFMKNGKDIDKFTFNYLDETEQDAEKEQYAHTESDILLKSLTDSLDVLRKHPVDNSVYITNEIVTPDVKVDIGETKVDVNVPESEVKNVVQVDVPSAVINIEPSDVVVENVVPVPEVKIENIIELPDRKPRKTTVKRDSYGNIIEMDTK